MDETLRLLSDFKNHLRDICDLYGLSVKQVMGKCRDKHLVNARMQLALRMRKMGYSFPDIGYCMHRHHTTIMNLIERSKKKGKIQ